MPYVYILECADLSYYVGSTWDLDVRVSEHNAGGKCRYTSRPGRRPVKVVWTEEYDRIDDAFGREKQIQGWSRAKRRALIEGRLGDLPGLARTSPRLDKLDERTARTSPRLDKLDERYG